MTTAPIPLTSESAARPQDLRLLDAWDALASPSIKVISTDGFDTLVWRTVPEPVDAFPLIAERLRERGQLSPSLGSEAFGTLRRIAERREPPGPPSPDREDGGAPRGDLRAHRALGLR
jgi:hypothetical protein